LFKNNSPLSLFSLLLLSLRHASCKGVVRFSGESHECSLTRAAFSSRELSNSLEPVG
jgi:hypothetical protein